MITSGRNDLTIYRSEGIINRRLMPCCDLCFSGIKLYFCKKNFTMFQYSIHIKYILSLLLIVAMAFSSCKKDPSQAAIDEADILDYVEANELEGQFTPSGLYYIIYEPGGVVHPTVTSTITVDYHGYLLNGETFDQDTDVTFSLVNLISGWQEGLQLIGAGGEIKLIIPSGLAYGSGSRQGIPANSVLVFDLTLVTFTE